MPPGDPEVAREARRRRRAGDVDVARGVDRDRRGFVEARGAEQPRVAQDRIDDECLAAIEAAEREADGAVGVQDVAAGHGDARLAFELIRERRPDAHWHRGCAKLQIAVGADRDTAGAGELEPHLPGIGARVDQDVVFDLVVGAVVGDVDAGIDVVEADARARLETELPAVAIGADQVVHGRRRAFQAHFTRTGGRAREPHRDRIGVRRGRRARALRRAHLGPGRPDVDGVPGRTGDEDAGAVVGGGQRLEPQRNGRPGNGRGRERRIGRANGGRRG